MGLRSAGDLAVRKVRNSAGNSDLKWEQSKEYLTVHHSALRTDFQTAHCLAVPTVHQMDSPRVLQMD